MEKWLPVKGFEGYYEVSDLGQVRSIATIRPHGGYRRRKWPGRVLSAKPKEENYCKVTLYGDRIVREVRVHVLVAEHFVPNPGNMPFVCHKDDDKSNNAAINLYWGSNADNMRDRWNNGGASARQKHSEALTGVWADPKLRARHSEMMFNRWENPTYKDKLLKTFQDPDRRKKLSKIHTERWTPALRAKAAETALAVAPKYTYKGVTRSLIEWANHLGIPRSRLQYRLSKNMPLVQVFTTGKFKPGRKGSNPK